MEKSDIDYNSIIAVICWFAIGCTIVWYCI
jgi:hypothetical protein